MASNSNDSEKKRRKRRGERKDGRILVTLAVGRTQNGKSKRKYFYGHSRQEAERKRDEYRRRREIGLYPNAENMELNDWIDEWYKRYKPNVTEEYSRNINVPIKRLRKSLGNRLIRTIVEADLQRELFSVSDKSSSTIKKYYSIMRQVFSKAKKNKIIPDDPSEDLTIPHGTDGTHRALESWESDTIIKNWSAHRAGIWALLMLLCGLRRSEIIALDWQDVDMKKRQIHVRQKAVILSNQSVVKDKTKSVAGTRSLPICDTLYAALDSIPKEKRSGNVCLSSKGKRLTGSGFSRGWEGFNLAMQRILNGEDLDQRGRRKTPEERIAEVEKSGKTYVLFHVRAHDLRHTFATALYDAGVSIKAAQYYLGHADTKMTIDLYTHLSTIRLNAERRQLTGFLDEWIESVKKDPETIVPES